MQAPDIPHDVKHNSDVLARWLAAIGMLGAFTALGLCLQHLG